MLMATIVGLAVVTTILMAVDWYIWDPRHRATYGNPAARAVNEGNYHVDLRSAA